MKLETSKQGTYTQKTKPIHSKTAQLFKLCVFLNFQVYVIYKFVQIAKLVIILLLRLMTNINAKNKDVFIKINF